MGKRRFVVMAACMLALTTGFVACATQMGGGSDSGRGVLHKIRATYNAKEKSDQDKRIKVHQVDSNDNNSSDPLRRWNRCPAGSAKCKQGHPVDEGGNPVLDQSKAIEDTVLFVSDYYNPGRSCVCYGAVCYCN